MLQDGRVERFVGGAAPDAIDVVVLLREHHPSVVRVDGDLGAERWLLLRWWSDGEIVLLRDNVNPDRCQ